MVRREVGRRKTEGCFLPARRRGAQRNEGRASGMSGMSGFGVVCLYSENRAKAPAGGKGRRGMAGRKKAENKKTMREILDAFLRMPAPESALEEKALLLAQARGAPLDLYEAVVLTQIAKAMKGDTSAAAFVREKPLFLRAWSILFFSHRSASSRPKGSESSYKWDGRRLFWPS